MLIFVTVTIGAPYERCPEIKEFGSVREAEDWINQAIMEIKR